MPSKQVTFVFVLFEASLEEFYPQNRWKSSKQAQIQKWIESVQKSIPSVREQNECMYCVSRTLCICVPFFWIWLLCVVFLTIWRQAQIEKSRIESVQISAPGSTKAEWVWGRASKQPRRACATDLTTCWVCICSFEFLYICIFVFCIFDKMITASNTKASAQHQNNLAGYAHWTLPLVECKFVFLYICIRQEVVCRSSPWAAVHCTVIFQPVWSDFCPWVWEVSSKRSERLGGLYFR